MSASHNIHSDAGFKLFGIGGLKLDNEKTAKVQYAANKFTGKYLLGKRAPNISHELAARYPKLILSMLDEDLRRDKFLAGETIVIDAANGAAYKTAPYILEELGANVVLLNADSKRLINDNCGATEPDGMAAKVKELNARYGLAVDGDADRAIGAVIDAEGKVRILDGDDSLHIIINGMDRLGLLSKRGVVVTDYTNLGLIKALRNQDVEVEVVGNGDRAILEKLHTNGYPLGGELTGHTLLNDVAERNEVVLTGDGTLTALRQLELAALNDAAHSNSTSISEMANWEKYPSELSSVKLPKGVNCEQLMQNPEIIKHLEVVSTKLGKAGRHHVRASGTEPRVRILVEHQSPEIVKDVSDELRTLISQVALSV